MTGPPAIGDRGFLNTTARVAPSTRRYYQSSRSHNCKLALLGATLALAVGSAAQESIHHVSLSKANSGKLREEARRLLREARHSIPSLDSQLGDGSTIVDRQLRAQDFNSVLSGVESLQPISWRVYDRRWQFAAGPFGAILAPSGLAVRMGRRNRLCLAMVAAGD